MATSSVSAGGETAIGGSELIVTLRLVCGGGRGDASNSSAGADIAHGGDKNQETGTASPLGGGIGSEASPFHHPGLGSSE